MKKRTHEQKLRLGRDTLHRLDLSQHSVGGGTLTFEGGCDTETCPQPGTGCGSSTLSCTLRA